MEVRPPSEAAAGLGAHTDEALLEIRVPAAIIDRAGVIRWLNARAIEVVGNLVGRPLWELIAPEQKSSDRMLFAKQIIGTLRTVDRRSVLAARDGTRVPVDVHTVALTNGEHVVGVFGIADDRGRSSKSRPQPLSRGTLTPRQYEVLGYFARGYSTAQIAVELHVSRETVRNHVRGVLATLGVHSRLEAVVEARRRGLID